MRKMTIETEYYVEVVRSICKAVKCKIYVELGVNKGKTISKIYPFVKRAIGVDIVDVRENKVGEFFLGTTDNWF